MSLRSISRSVGRAWRKLAVVSVVLLRSPDNEAITLSPAVVDEVSGWSGLDAPEQAVIQRLGSWLTGKMMLDVGVGCGRTTPYFAPLVSSYVGVDYAAPMIGACSARLGDQFDNVSLSVADARDLSRFGTGSFDLVLFSFSGLDSIGHDDRLRALAEFRRVCDPGGFLCFSTHNLCGVSQLFQVQEGERGSLGARARGMLRRLALRLLNESPRALARKQHALIRNGALSFRISLYYVRPSEQLAQLRAAGFPAVEIYGVDGRQISCEDADQAGDSRLYFLASQLEGETALSKASATARA